MKRPPRPIRYARLKAPAPETIESEIDIAYNRQLMSMIRAELHFVSPAWRKFIKTRGDR